MSATEFLFTSESVSEGHPDKIADQISDAILDAFLTHDPLARVACETFVTTGMVLIGGEITTHARIDIEPIVRRTIAEIGYNDTALGFDSKSCAVITTIGKQSPDIARGIDHDQPEAQGAGDQGMMFGYATNETDVFMPAPIYFAHQLMRRQAHLRKSGILPWLGPDAKAQVTVHYVKGRPHSIPTIVLSTQHLPDMQQRQIEEAVIDEIIKPTLPPDLLKATNYLVNPTGRFVIGGPQGDCGLTGRKIMVDSYGGIARHGGGCFSGKDPSKVDRSAAYAARYIAKNIVAAGFADRCEIQLSYAIGRTEPTSLYIETFGTGKISDEKLLAIIQSQFDLRPFGIIQMLNLLRPIYRPLAAYGHFGRDDLNLTWEAIDKVNQLQII